MSWFILEKLHVAGYVNYMPADKLYWPDESSPGLHTYLHCQFISVTSFNSFLQNTAFFGTKKTRNLPCCKYKTYDRNLIFIYQLYYSWLENHQVDTGLLIENDYTIGQRKVTCQKLCELEDAGYYVAYLDES